MAGKGWDAVDRDPFKGAGRFLRLESGETVVFRVLDEEPHTINVHHVTQVIDGEEVYRSIHATEKADDDFIDANSHRFPAQPRHALRVAVYDDDMNLSEVKVLEGGVQIFRSLKKMWQRWGDITGFDIVLSREGEGKKSEYTIEPAPQSQEPDLEEWWDKIQEEEWTWESIYPPITSEDQKKILEEAKIDITYDPVVDLMAEMDPEEALEIRFTFGQYGPDNFPRGKTVREVLAIDAGYLEWVAANVTSNDELVAAARLAIQNTEALERPSASRKSVGPGKKKAKPPKGKKPAPAPELEPEEEEMGVTEGPTRDDWKGKTSVEHYLSRWFDNNGNKVGMALSILEGEGLEWDSEKKEAVPIGSLEEQPDEPEDEDEDWDDEEDEEEESDDMGRDALLEAIAEAFKADDEYEDAMKIVAMIKKHGNGKTRVKDLSVDQLRSLLRDLTV